MIYNLCVGMAVIISQMIWTNKPELLKVKPEDGASRPVAWCNAAPNCPIGGIWWTWCTGWALLDCCDELDGVKPPDPEPSVERLWLRAAKLDIVSVTVKNLFYSNCRAVFACRNTFQKILWIRNFIKIITSHWDVISIDNQMVFCPTCAQYVLYELGWNGLKESEMLQERWKGLQMIIASHSSSPLCIEIINIVNISYRLLMGALYNLLNLTLGSVIIKKRSESPCGVLYVDGIRRRRWSGWESGKCLRRDRRE